MSMAAALSRSAVRSKAAVVALLPRSQICRRSFQSSPGSHFRNRRDSLQSARILKMITSMQKELKELATSVSEVRQDTVNLGTSVSDLRKELATSVSEVRQDTVNLGKKMQKDMQGALKGAVSEAALRTAGIPGLSPMEMLPAQVSSPAAAAMIYNFPHEATSFLVDVVAFLAPRALVDHIEIWRSDKRRGSDGAAGIVEDFSASEAFAKLKANPTCATAWSVKGELTMLLLLQHHRSSLPVTLRYILALAKALVEFFDAVALPKGVSTKKIQKLQQKWFHQEHGAAMLCVTHLVRRYLSKRWKWFTRGSFKRAAGHILGKGELEIDAVGKLTQRVLPSGTATLAPQEFRYELAELKTGLTVDEASAQVVENGVALLVLHHGLTARHRMGAIEHCLQLRKAEGVALETTEVHSATDTEQRTHGLIRYLLESSISFAAPKDFHLVARNADVQLPWFDENGEDVEDPDCLVAVRYNILVVGKQVNQVA